METKEKTIIFENFHTRLFAHHSSHEENSFFPSESIFSYIIINNFR